MGSHGREEQHQLGAGSFLLAEALEPVVEFLSQAALVPEATSGYGHFLEHVDDGIAEGWEVGCQGVDAV